MRSLTIIFSAIGHANTPADARPPTTRPTVHQERLGGGPLEESKLQNRRLALAVNSQRGGTAGQKRSGLLECPQVDGDKCGAWNACAWVGYPVCDQERGVDNRLIHEQATSLLCHASVRPTWGSPSQANDHESLRACARKGTHVSGMEGADASSHRQWWAACDDPWLVCWSRSTPPARTRTVGGSPRCRRRGHWKPDWVRENEVHPKILLTGKRSSLAA